MHMKRMKFVVALFVVLSLALSGCQTPQNITYFQDSAQFSDIELARASAITVKPGDQLSINVNSKDPQLAAMFNLPIQGYRIGATSVNSLNSQASMSYSVDSNGDIDFPVLGKIKVGGCNRETIASFIKECLIKEELIQDPVVTVEFTNLYFSVLGEVARPGRFDIKHDRVTVLDAIAMAGDLTINGMRENIVVWREEGDHQVAYHIDLSSSKSVYNSPAYYLQQKDLVYVEPNEVRKRQSTVNGNNVRSTSFWISLTSLATSVAVLVVNMLK